MKSKQDKLANWCIRHFRRRAESMEAHMLMSRTSELGVPTEVALAKLLKSSWGTVIDESPSRLRQSRQAVVDCYDSRPAHREALRGAADVLFPGHELVWRTPDLATVTLNLLIADRECRASLPAQYSQLARESWASHIDGRSMVTPHDAQEAFWSAWNRLVDVHQPSLPTHDLDHDIDLKAECLKWITTAAGFSQDEAEATFRHGRETTRQAEPLGDIPGAHGPELHGP